MASHRWCHAPGAERRGRKGLVHLSTPLESRGRHRRPPHGQLIQPGDSTGNRRHNARHCRETSLEQGLMAKVEGKALGSI